MSTIPPNARSRRLWKRILIWGGVVVAVLIVAAAIGVEVLLHNGAIHGYLLRQARARASAALGVPVQIGNYQLHLNGTSPSLEVDNLVIPGKAPFTAQPLARIAHLRVGIQITSLLHQSWYFSSVEIDHPVIHFYQDAQGRNNLPLPGKGSSSSGTNLFQLGIRHAAVRQGEVYVNDRQANLQADVHGLHLAAVYTPLGQTYRGTFGYTRGSVQVAGNGPVQASLEANFAASPLRLQVSKLVIHSGPAVIHASLQLTDYAAPRIATNFQVSLDLTSLRSVLHQPGIPTGTVHVVGNAHYAAAPGVAFLTALQAEGAFTSPLLHLRTSGVTTPIAAVQGGFHLAQGNLQVTNLHARVAGGAAQASLTIRDLGGAAQGHAQGRIQDARLGDLVRFAGNAPVTTLAHAGVTGTVNGAGEADWSGGFQAMRATGQATLHSLLAPQTPGAVALPMQAAAHARFDDAQHQLVLSQTEIQLPRSTITLAGALGTAPASPTRLQVILRTHQFGELASVVNRLRRGFGGQPLPPLGLTGEGAFTGQVRGTLQNPDIAGNFQATNLRIHGSLWTRASFHLEASPSLLAVSQASFSGPGGASARFQLTLALQQWAVTHRGTIAATVNLQRIPLALATALTGRPLPLRGNLNLQAAVRGPLDGLQGQGKLALQRAQLVTAGAVQPLRSVTASFQIGGAPGAMASPGPGVVAANFNLGIAGGTVRGQATYDLTAGAYRGQVHAAGIELSQLALLARRKLKVGGTIAIAATGQGTLANPGAQITLTSPQLTLAGQSMNAIRLEAQLANHVLTAELNSEALNTALHGQARIALTGNDPASITLDTASIPIAPLLALYAPGLAGTLNGTTQVQASLQGPLAHLADATAQVRLPVLALNLPPALRLAAAAPVQFDLAHGVITLRPVRFQGTSTDITVGGVIPLRRTAPMLVTARGTVDLKLIQAFNPQLTTGGQLQLDIRAGGSMVQPAVNGTVQVVNASLNTFTFPVGLQNGNGTLQIAGNRITIAHFQATLGGGTLTASGGLLLQQVPRFDLGVQLSQVRLLYPSSLRESLEGNLSFTGTAQAALLSGRVQVTSVAATPQFDFTNVISQLTSGTASVVTPGSFTQDVSLNVTVTTPNEIHTVSRDFSLQANANVNVRGTLSQPVVLGRVNISSGDLIYRGNRYLLQNGTLDFINPTNTLPTVNLTASTTIQQYALNLHFQGPADNLRTTYTSTPSLPPADIINLLAFGQTTEASAANPTPGNLGAENLIASEVSSQITGRVQKIAGISQLSVDPILGGNQQNPGARVTVQQRVTGNLFVTISTDVTSTQHDEIEIQYKISPKVSISGVRNQNGGFGITTRITKVW